MTERLGLRPPSADGSTYVPDRWTKRRARIDAAFWTRIRQSGECWEWTGWRKHPDPYGRGTYGVLRRFGREIYAHRRAYELTHGPIPDGMVVMHSCDNPPCIRPDHLSIGTDADNMADASSRGRLPSGPANHFYKDGKSVERGRRERAARAARSVA